jgi:hypothetical protein
METKHKKGLTLGDLITAAYQVWGATQAGKMVQWALNTRLVVLQKHPHLLLSSAKARPA